MTWNPLKKPALCQKPALSQESINQLINQAIKQSINQAIKQTNKQSNNQLIDSFKLKLKTTEFFLGVMFY